MRKSIVVFLIGVIGTVTFANAQSNEIKTAFGQAEILPQERVFVHVNASLFLAGESLFYKVYCINNESNGLSTYSTIAYVELIGENKDVVFKHKVSLESGVGYGDFIIPVTVNSGNYKLIAYTQWMKNEGVDSFFKSDISIINPFQSNQDVILVGHDLNQSSSENGLLESITDNEIQAKMDSPFLEIDLQQKTFKKRAKVSLTLKSKIDENLAGNYSISVRKVDNLDRLACKLPSLNSYLSEKENNSKNLKSINYLPELRGELISGKLLRLSDNNPVPNEKIALSIHQNDFILKISKTNPDGVFYFNVKEDYNKETGVLQVLDKDNQDYKIVLDDPESMDYGSLNFGSFKISSSYKNILEQRNIYNQIENGYFDLKSNTLKQIDTIQPFFGNYFATFFLDDYTRFNKIQETFVEVVKDAYIKRDNNQKFNFHVNSLNPYEQSEKPAGVIVDGIFLQDFDALLAFDSRRVKRISIARTNTNFILGTKTFGGLIVIETIDGKFYDELPKNKLTQVSLFNPQPKKSYYKKTYTNDNTLDRVPDYRNQLVWEPNFQMKSKEIIYNFFTSDNTGSYQICIEGFTANGQPVSIRDFIIID